MDKKEFLKALFIVGLLNTLVTVIVSGLIYLIIIAITTMPFVLLAVLLFVLIGYVSAYIYLKFKEKEWNI